MEVCLSEFKNAMDSGRPVQTKVFVYPEESNDEDIISDNYFEQVHEEFGMHHLRGTAVSFHNPDTNLIYSTERLFRTFLKGKKIKHAVEIGTWRGVSTALLAHYADRVTTIDLTYYPDAMPVWMYFGVKDRIKYFIAEDNSAKIRLLDRLDFDFAFIDGDHKFDEVALDYQFTKKCGRVLFHDYGIRHLPSVTKFVDRLSPENLKIRMPFAYWEEKCSD